MVATNARQIKLWVNRCMDEHSHYSGSVKAVAFDYAERFTLGPAFTLSSQNFLAEGGECYFNRKVSGLVMFVDDGVDLDDLQAQHAAVVGDDFHGEVRFPVGGAAPDRRADAGSVFGVDPVHVERDVVAGGTTASHAQGFFHHGTHAALVDVAHGEDFDAALADVFFLVGVDVADANQHAVFRTDLGREIVDVGEFRRPKAHDGAERHTVDVATGRRFGGVDIAVGVDPDQADALVLPTVKFGDSGDRAGSDGVIPAQHERDFPRFERFEHEVRALGAGGGDFLQIFRVGVAEFFLFGNGDRDVAAVLNDVADGFEAGLEAGDAHGGGAHVDTAARLAEVEGDANDTDLFGGDAAEGR